MICAAISPILYTRGAGGIPSTATPLPDVRPYLTGYTHSIAAAGGFEGCTIDASTDLTTALTWLDNLMATVVVYGPWSEVLWEGFLSSVSVQAGSERIDLSLDDVANAVAVRYQPGVGAQITTSFLVDGTGQSVATYGRKELVYGGSGMSTTAADILRDTLLKARQFPVARRSGGASTGEGGADIRLTLGCTGWYYSLGWLTTSNTTTTTAVTTTQVGTLLTTAAATNAFISTSTLDIQGSGLSDTQYIEPNTPIRQKVERLLSLGNSSGQRIAYGVYEGQRFRAKTWAGATPDTITYMQNLGDGQIRSMAGGVVDPWLVRPDAMYQVADLLNPLLPSTADSPSAMYIERVTCQVGTNSASVRLEPARSSELDVLLARIRN